MSKQTKRVMIKADFPARASGGSARSKRRAEGCSPASLELFAGIHKSSRFTLDAAHDAFAGFKRAK